MLLATLTRFEISLIAYGISGVVGAIAYWIIRRYRVDPTKRASVGAVKHHAEATAGVPLAIGALCLVGIAFLLIVASAPWWTALFSIPLAAWIVWWLPGSRRSVISQASIFVQGLPARVSAFVADIPGHVKWSPGVVSCTPQIQGPRGPRYLGVERGPSGQEMEGVIELTRDEPGVEVDLLVEGAGATGDYYHFAAQNGGTIVTKQTVVELPYLLALIGGMFLVKGEAPAAQQRRINEVQALKTAFESDPIQ